MKQDGVGARLIRKEDDRYMRGRGQFVGDISLARLHDAAFVRSPVAHARIENIKFPESLKGKVFSIAESADVETAIQLEIPLNSPTAEAHCIVIDADGVVIYSGDIIYPGDRVNLNIELLDSST